MVLGGNKRPWGRAGQVGGVSQADPTVSSSGYYTQSVLNKCVLIVDCHFSEVRPGISNSFL